MSATVSNGLCTFRIGHEWFALPIGTVVELLGHRPVQPVPRAARQIHGLLNLRGQILTVLDPEFFCQHEADWEPMLVVFVAGDRRIALAVEEIGDVLPVQTESRHEAPPHLNDALRRICIAAHSVEESLILELDPVAMSRVHRPAARTRNTEETS